MSEVDVATKRWRSIDELAGLIGVYCWVENRIFELSGFWATGTTTARGPGSNQRNGSGAPACPGVTDWWRPFGPSGSRCGPVSTGAPSWPRRPGRWLRRSTRWPHPNPG